MLRQDTEFRDANTRHAETYEEVRIIGEKRGFVVAPWDGTEQTEQRIKDDTKATIRLPLRPAGRQGPHLRQVGSDRHLCPRSLGSTRAGWVTREAARHGKFDLRALSV